MLLLKLGANKSPPLFFFACSALTLFRTGRSGGDRKRNSLKGKELWMRQSIESITLAPPGAAAADFALGLGGDRGGICDDCSALGHTGDWTTASVDSDSLHGSSV